MRSESARKARIEEIASQIAELSNELQGLLLEDEASSTSSATNRSTPAPRRPPNVLRSTQRIDPRSYFSVGDRIVITNNYRGYRGHTGTITEVGEGPDNYIHFRQDSPSIITKRKPHNIRKID